MINHIFLIPINSLIFCRGAVQPPTSVAWCLWCVSMYACMLYINIYVVFMCIFCQTTTVKIILYIFPCIPIYFSYKLDYVDVYGADLPFTPDLRGGPWSSSAPCASTALASTWSPSALPSTPAPPGPGGARWRCGAGCAVESVGGGVKWRCFSSVFFPWNMGKNAGISTYGMLDVIVTVDGR